MTSPPAAKTITGRQPVVIGALVLLIVLLLVLLMPWRRHPRPLNDLQVAEAWLECIDCQGPFLKRLHEAASDNDTIVRFLRAALLQGPSAARLKRHERDLLRTWAMDSLHWERQGAATGGDSLAGPSHTADAPPMKVILPPSKPAFLDRYRRGFVVKWQGRAAMALGVIRSDSALAALDSALLVVPRDRGDSIVRGWVEQARADKGLEALGQWQEVRTQQGSKPRHDSLRGQ